VYDALHDEVKMTRNLTGQPPSESEEVFHLLARRSQVQEWLKRLDTQRGAVKDRILERVREDYEARLQETVETLARHREAVRNRFDEAGERLGTAEEEHLAILDRLEEARLRHLIGEMDEPHWAETSGRLGKLVEAARENEEAAREENRRLAELLQQLEERGEIEKDSPPLDAYHPGDIEDDEDYEDGTPGGTALAGASFSAGPSASLSAGAPFLAEIDRAISGHEEELSSPPPPSRAVSLDENPEMTAPKPGLKCSECGYTNDLGAWFCGVCGADVG